MHRIGKRLSCASQTAASKPTRAISRPPSACPSGGRATSSGGELEVMLDQQLDKTGIAKLRMMEATVRDNLAEHSERRPSHFPHGSSLARRRRFRALELELFS